MARSLSLYRLLNALATTPSSPDYTEAKRLVSGHRLVAFLLHDPAVHGDFARTSAARFTEFRMLLGDSVLWVPVVRPTDAMLERIDSQGDPEDTFAVSQGMVDAHEGMTASGLASHLDLPQEAMPCVVFAAGLEANTAYWAPLTEMNLQATFEGLKRIATGLTADTTRGREAMLAEVANRAFGELRYDQHEHDSLVWRLSEYFSFVGVDANDDRLADERRRLARRFYKARLAKARHEGREDLVIDLAGRLAFLLAESEDGRKEASSDDTVDLAFSLSKPLGVTGLIAGIGPVLGGTMFAGASLLSPFTLGAGALIAGGALLASSKLRQKARHQLGEAGKAVADVISSRFANQALEGSSATPRFGLRGSYAEPTSLRFLQSGFLVLSALQKEADAEADYGPVVTQIGKYFEYEVNHSVIQWARARRGIELPAYYTRRQPGKEAIVHPLLKDPKPIDLNDGATKHPDDTTWKPLSLGQAQLAYRAVVKEVGAPPIPKDCHQRLLKGWAHLSEMRNRAAHDSVMSEIDAIAVLNTLDSLEGGHVSKVLYDLKNQLRGESVVVTR